MAVNTLTERTLDTVGQSAYANCESYSTLCIQYTTTLNGATSMSLIIEATCEPVNFSVPSDSAWFNADSQARTFTISSNTTNSFEFQDKKAYKGIRLRLASEVGGTSGTVKVVITGRS